MDESSDRSARATPREIANFLITLKPMVARAVAIRASWIKELGRLFAEIQQGNAARVTARAGRLGREHVGAFRDVRTSVARLSPPAGCQEVHRSVLLWTDSLVKACEALIEVGNSGQIAGMQIAQRNVTEARHAARRFNSEYNRLLTELRVAVRSARRG
ncbi:MAG TPA: hypothetical protein VGL23_14005 [Chloroflexota bacterium]